ncbi:Uncharacterised protein [Vibrio cholerae]|nr:Uncharacterised protein [Vibrio cholerae]
MVARCHVGFRATDFVEAGQQLRRDLFHINFRCANGQCSIGNDIGICAFIAQFMLITSCHIIDQTFI